MKQKRTFTRSTAVIIGHVVNRMGPKIILIFLSPNRIARSSALFLYRTAKKIDFNKF